jgi:hypothetical protein
VTDNGHAGRKLGAILMKLLSAQDAGIDEEVCEVIFVGKHGFLEKGFGKYLANNMLMNSYDLRMLR